MGWYMAGSMSKPEQKKQEVQNWDKQTLIAQNIYTRTLVLSSGPSSHVPGFVLHVPSFVRSLVWHIWDTSTSLFFPAQALNITIFFWSLNKFEKTYSQGLSSFSMPTEGNPIQHSAHWSIIIHIYILIKLKYKVQNNKICNS